MRKHIGDHRQTLGPMVAGKHVRPPRRWARQGVFEKGREAGWMCIRANTRSTLQAKLEEGPND
eukprot:768263-Alexandrium_andersonii.AAC.1